jgi:hypothetical protein
MEGRVLKETAMKRLLSVFAIVALASPVFAQDDFGFGGTLSQSEIDQLLGGGGGGRGGRGRGNQNVQSILPDPTVMYNQLKDLLKNKKVPLAKEQEKPLQTLLNDQTKIIRADLEKQFPALNPANQQQNQQQNQQNNQNNQNRGNQNQNNQNSQTVRIDKVILSQNGQLLTEMKAALAPDQVALLDKAEKDKKCLVLIDGYYTFLNSGQRGNGTTNNREWCTWGDFTPTQRLAPVRDLLKKEKKPLTAEQDAKLIALIEARMPLVEKAFRDDGVLQNNNQNRGNNQQNPQQQQMQQLANNIVNNIFNNLGIANPNNQNRGNNANFEQIIQQACAPGATPEQREQAAQQLTQQFQGGGGRGGRGNFNNAGNSPNLDQLCQNFGNRGNRGNNNNNVNFNVVRTEVEKQNESLLDKVIAMLNPDQQRIIKRFKYDQIKSKGGVERIRGILEEEGTPLTPAQIPPIQALFNDSNQTLRQLAQQIVLASMEKQPPPPQAFQQNQNQNQNRGNNFNNNQSQPNPLQQYQQQMRDSLLPRIQQERQRIENAMMNSVMKLLTPAQVASYKINLQMPPL